jgi:hypothetical protein
MERGRNPSLFHIASIASAAHPTCYSVDNAGCCIGVKQAVCEADHALFMSRLRMSGAIPPLNAVHSDVLFDSQGIRIIQSNTPFFIVKIHLYTRLHVSAPRSHHQASTIEQIQIQFCTIGIPRVYSAEVYCLRCMIKLT